MRISDWSSDVCSSDLRSEIDLAAEGQRGENGKLVRGVGAVDVEAGVGLRVAEPLRLGQHALEVLSGGGRLRGGGTVLVAGHAGQDVVAGAVEDAVDAVDAVGGEALAQALDDGNAAGHRGLVADGAADALGQSGKRGAVVREQRLVRSEERRGGKECVSTCRSRGSPYH